MVSKCSGLLFRFICLSIALYPISVTSQTISWQATNGPGFAGSSAVTPVCVTPSGTILAAVHDNQPPVFLFRTSNRGTTWANSDTGLLNGIGAIAIASSDTIYAALSATLNSVGGFYRSIDGGRTWSMVNTTSLPDNVHSIAIASSGAIYLACASPVPALRGVYRSTDGGVIWSQSNLGNGAVNCIVIDSSGTLFAGGSVTLSGNGIWRSTDHGASWVRIDTSNPIRAIVQFSQEVLFASNDYGPLLRSTDSGNTWIQVAGSTYINGFVVTSRQHIVGSSVFGVRVSTDSGQTWTLQNLGLTETQVYSIALSPDGYLYCGTWGGRVFRSTQPTSVIGPNAHLPTMIELEQNYPNPFNSSTTLVFSIPEQAHVRILVYDILGRLVTTLVDRWVQPGRHLISWDPDFASSSPYFVGLQVGNTLTSRRVLFLK